MHHLLSPKVHGIIDYLAVAMLAVAPALFGFAGIAAYLCYASAVGLLGLSLLTAYPLGIAHVIPFTIHGGIEVGMTLALVAAPWLFGFSDVPAARNFFLISGVALGAVYLATNYKAADSYRKERPIAVTRESYGWRT
ncbi:MAG: hypothetical protein HOW73_39160 [Polyangiaceae bacterium]|nr:hypothetical protein [Polyangiaceae bacterium]